MKFYKKYIAAISFGLLIGATAYGAGTVAGASEYEELEQQQYKEARAHIASLPAGTDLNAPGALGAYPGDGFDFPADRPPLHGCVFFNCPSQGRLRALLETTGVDVDVLHNGVTPLWTVLGKEKCYSFSYGLEIARILIGFGASLLKPCHVETSKGSEDFAIEDFGSLYGDKEAYCAIYRFDDQRDISNPLELGLSSFMSLTKTFIGPRYADRSPESVKLLGAILKKALESCALEKTQDGLGLQEYIRGYWCRVGPKAPIRCLGYKEACYKIIQSGGLPAFAITKNVYDMITGGSS